MILSGPEIIASVKDGTIEIHPFEVDNVNPASIDLRLGPRVACYKRWVFEGTDGVVSSGTNWVIDIKNPDHFDITEFEFNADSGVLLRPGVLYLMHTVETVHTKSLVPVLDGKSSIGRLGIVVHLTAGFGDPGFDGQYTLEVSVAHPVRVYAGMRFCQMRFHKLCGQPRNYQESGHYVGANAAGPVPSKVYEQFNK